MGLEASKLQVSIKPSWLKKGHLDTMEKVKTRLQNVRFTKLNSLPATSCGLTINNIHDLAIQARTVVGGPKNQGPVLYNPPNFSYTLMGSPWRGAQCWERNTGGALDICGGSILGTLTDAEIVNEIHGSGHPDLHK